MKATTVVYAVLGLVGLGATISVPVWLTRSGSDAIPFWTAAVNPGPLSAAHDFIGAQCETCHTPVLGVEARACLTCHATAAPVLLTKPTTAFHANIGTCAGCHVEHQGRDRRPINMDHSVLVMAARRRAIEARRSP
ncbi:cytochrome c3 family protein [Roseicella aerolata]|uniref:Cytochrome c3 family protein n=1 Tax=Roseicella aerolata TaxID=2883479 RepID=A0A9X1IHH8_9PROT|nr:cytochrome c3 family protein [Roseicella aerolata]MCB4824931.1 cytochrome c3 family protein [Roseicella aerolata]